MTELFQQILEWVSLHPGWAYSVIFLVAMAESLAIVGLVVPGVVIMFGIGALIAGGAIVFLPAMGWAVAGAVIGDGFSFWLGSYYRDQLRSIWPFNRHPKSLERGIEFFQRYGGKSVALGRFFGPIRAVIPLVAGMMGMHPLRFLFANVLSALVWAPVYLLPGMVFGASLELASEVAMRLVFLALLLLFFGWAGYNLTRWLFRRFSPHTSRWVGRLLEWGEAHPVLGEIASALADPKHPETRGLSILATLLVVATALFTLLVGLLPGAGLHNRVDTLVLETLQSLRTPLADSLMIYLTRLTDAGVAYPLAIGIGLFLLLSGQRGAASHWVAAVLFALLVSPLLKWGLQVPRPEVVNMPPDSYAFPSGHTLRAVVLFGFLSVLIARPLSDRWRWLPYSLAGLLILAVGLSRLYLGVHWLSDVIGSLTLGLAWVAFLGLAYHRHEVKAANWKSLMAAALLLMVTAFSIETALHQERNLARYQPLRTLEIIDPAEWWQGAADLPETRVDLLHQGEHPLNLQYAGRLRELAEALQPAGWQAANRGGWRGWLRLLAPDQPLAALPVLPQVHDGRHEALVLVKTLPGDRRLVLRLWESDFRLGARQRRVLWLGSVSEQDQVTLLGAFTFASTGAGFNPALAQLRRDLQALLPAAQLELGDPLRIRGPLHGN